MDRAMSANWTEYFHSRGLASLEHHDSLDRTKCVTWSLFLRICIEKSNILAPTPLTRVHLRFDGVYAVCVSLDLRRALGGQGCGYFGSGGIVISQ